LLLLGLALAFPSAALAQDPPPPPVEPVVPDGVTVAGVAVGGMTAAQATAAVQAFFNRPFVLTFRARAWNPGPGRLGMSADVAGAIVQALAAPAGTALPLAVTVNRTTFRAYVRRLGRAIYRPPRNSQVFLRHLRPFITEARAGLALSARPTRAAIRAALYAHERGPIELITHRVPPRITRANFGPVIVIRRGSRRLYLYRGMTFVRSFGVAVGLPQYPTPLGRWRIVVMARNPWWYPPDSGWAAGASPIPPGPGNPLGTRWMGLSAPGVGIHGTPDAASIGYSASHGCIRMRIPDAEWLFERVRIGTTVFIVRA
jgi:lipoprotein-anchoring transpeptidase ErfK/SrfK